jgi:hypothetical protein
LKSSVSSIVSMEPRKHSSSLYSRVYIPGLSYSPQPTAEGCRIRSAGHQGSLQSLLKLSPCVPQLGGTIEDERLGRR